MSHNNTHISLTSQKLHYVGLPTSEDGLQLVKGIVFDMDGTLIHEAIDYAAMRAALGIPYPSDVIVEIRSMVDVSKQHSCWQIIEHYESQARIDIKAHDGVSELLAFLRLHGVRMGLFTRNSTQGIDAMKVATGFEFDFELSREFEPSKPAPDGALKMAKEWGLDPKEVLFIGDSADDLACGSAAAMKTILFDPTHKKPHLHSVANFVIRSMEELMNGLSNGVLL